MLIIEFKYIVLLFGIVSVSNLVCSKEAKFHLIEDRRWTTNYKLQSPDNVPVLQEGAIRGALSDDALLADLDINEVGLTSIEAGAFKDLPNLYHLSIHQNPNLTEIKSGVFNTLTRLTGMSIYRNGVSKIASDAFDNIPNLEEINLSANKIHEINPEWFANTPVLKGLYLTRNQIEEIPANAFKNFQNKGNLTILLDYNSLKHIDDDAFKGLKHFSYLGLGSNKLTTINWNIFTGLNIELLELNDNQITCINEEDFEKAFVASKTNLERNPIEGECLEKIKKWAQDHQDKQIIL